MVGLGGDEGFGSVVSVSEGDSFEVWWDVAEAGSLADVAVGVSEFGDEGDFFPWCARGSRSFSVFGSV